MNVTVDIPTVLRHCCDGASQLTVTAVSTREALQQIERSHPALYRSVCDETGAIRRHVNLFVNSSLVRDEAGLDQALTAADVIAIFPAVSGG